ncbi:MAG TPA: hypothetical protein PLF89_10505, partial [bacterium]|nr:hypothetical protein [bacterium]
ITYISQRFTGCLASRLSSKWPIAVINSPYAFKVPHTEFYRHPESRLYAGVPDLLDLVPDPFNRFIIALFQVLEQGFIFLCKLRFHSKPTSGTAVLNDGSVLWKKLMYSPWHWNSSNPLRGCLSSMPIRIAFSPTQSGP